MTPGACPTDGDTPRMSIEVPVLEVLALADRLRRAAELGPRAAGRPAPPADAGELAPDLRRFHDAVDLAARALGTELEVLGDAVEAAGRSWLALDADLLRHRGQVETR
jgi:hypothetical protein